MSDQFDMGLGTSKHLMRTGFAISVTYLTAFIYFSYMNSTAFNELGPDEWADFLGGVFAPLAFLWLVLGFLQQGHELRQSAQALHLQAEELRNSVEQQRALVETTREQIEFNKQVLTETRTEQERRRRPVLRARAGGGSTSGRTINRNIIVENFGTSCTNVQLEITRNGVIQSTGSVNELPKGNVIHCQFTLDASEDINGMSISCRFVDQDNAEGVQTFIVTDDSPDGEYFSFKSIPQLESMP